MLVVRVSNAYAITPGPDDVRAGTMGLWFTVAGTATVVTTLGETITVGGERGVFFECPIRKVTAVAGATVLGVMGR
jgi:hypothetical protein